MSWLKQSEWEFEMISRYNAYYEELAHFYVPVKCSEGHLAPRYVSTGQCTVCVAIKNKQLRDNGMVKELIKRKTDEKHREYFRKYQQKYRLRKLANETPEDAAARKARQNQYQKDLRKRHKEQYGRNHRWLYKDETGQVVVKEGDKLERYREYQREYHRNYRQKQRELRAQMDPKDRPHTSKNTPEQLQEFAAYQRQYRLDIKNGIRVPKKRPKVVHGSVQENENGDENE